VIAKGIHAAEACGPPSRPLPTPTLGGMHTIRYVRLSGSGVSSDAPHWLCAETWLRGWWLACGLHHSDGGPGWSGWLPRGRMTQ
jgi:hypothetical protein